MSETLVHESDERKAIERLERLVTISQRQRWETEDLDWSLPVPDLTPEERDALNQLISLIYWSDKSGQSSLAFMAQHLEQQFWKDGIYEPDEVHWWVQRYLLVQRDDEVRHARVLERLFEAMDMRPGHPSPIHAHFLKVLAVGEDFDEKLVIIHWLVEVYAKILFEQLRERFPRTIIDAAFTRILLDESRHIAFGDCYMPIRIQEASWGEQLKILRAQLSSFGLMAVASFTERYTRSARVLGMDPRQFFEEGLELLERRHERFGRPSALLNVAPWARPLGGLII